MSGLRIGLYLMARIFSINFNEDDSVDVAGMALSWEELCFLFKITGSMTGVEADSIMEGGSRMAGNLYDEIRYKIMESFDVDNP